MKQPSPYAHLSIVGAFIVVAGLAAAAGSATTAYVAYSFGTDGQAVQQQADPRDEYDSSLRPSARSEEGTVRRNATQMLNEQERRMERIQDNMNEDESDLHGAASEEDDAEMRDPRAYGRAIRHCALRGYTRSRFATCVYDIMETGEFQGDAENRVF